MPTDEFKELKQRSLFSKLRRLFSTDVIVRNVGGKKLKVIDTDELAYATDRNTLRDRFNRIRTSAYNQYSRDFTLSYQAARIELFRDYDCVGPDTIIPLPDGTRPTIAELTEKYKDKPQERFYVFSYDHETDSIKLGKAYHPRKKKGKRQGYKVTFDDGSFIIGSLKHPFVMRDGNKKRLFELRIGDSVMPFYQKEYNCKYNKYKKLYNFSKGWQAEHVVIAEQFERSLNNNEVVHHKDFNGSNNSPENLKIMTKHDHTEFHANHSKNVLWGEENYENQLNKLKSNPNYINRKFHHWNGERSGENNPFHGNKHSDESNEKRSETLKEVFKNRDQRDVKNPKYRHDITFENVKEKAFEYYKEYSKINLWEFIEHIHCDHSTLQSRLKKEGHDWKTFKNEIVSTLNHKIVSIEQIGEVDVYDVTVEKYENFASDNCFLGNTMDMDPIISSALDIYADECLTQNELGDILTIRSTNDNIKQILHNLFYDILNIEFNLWSWTRNLVKYGDFYLKMYVSPEFGVYMVEPISSYNVTRVENSDLNNKNYIKFQVNLPEGGKIEELENYQVAHFRLLSDSNFLPYGKGIIEGARRVWKQVSLMEDAMLIHRIMRAPEKRIYKVDIGNIPPNEVDQYMEKLINKTKKVPYIDEKTGDYNLRFNLWNMVEDIYLPVRGSDSGTSIEPLSGMEFTGIDDIEYLRNKMMAALKIPKAFLGYEEDLCIAPYTKIPLLNGMEKTVEELINDYSNGIVNYVYSIDETTKNIVPGEIEWAGYTRKNAEIVRVHLDNGEYIDCTPDHNFLTRDGNWVEAQHLNENQPLMPLYRKKTTNKSKRGYEMVYHPSTKKYQEVHRLVAEYYGNITKGSGKVVHHKDFNKLNNYPENLDCTMSWNQHKIYHSKLSEKTVNSPINIQKRINDPLWLLNAKLNGKKGGLKSAKKLGEYAKTHAPVNKGKRTGITKVCNICKSSFYTFKSIKQTTCSLECSKVYFSGNNRYNTKFLNINFDCLLNAAKKSKSFKELEKTLGNIDRNTLNKVFKHHNINDKLKFINEYMPLAKNNRQFINNFTGKYKNHIVVRVEKLNIRIDTCDITVKKYHNFATSAGVIIHNSGKATLAAEDVRFARTVQRVQKFIVSELTKIAIVHLYSQGYRDADLVDFSLELTNPSTIFEKEKVSVWQEKVNVAKDMMEAKIYSKKWIYTNVFNTSDDDMTVISNDIVEDAKQAYRLKKIEDEGIDPAKPYNKINTAETGGGSETVPGELGSSKPETPAETPTPALKERDQTGRKKASDYPFGEDPLGSGENIRRSNKTTKKHPISHAYKNNSPLSFEGLDLHLNSDSKKSILNEKKESSKKSFLDESNIIE